MRNITLIQATTTIAARSGLRASVCISSSDSSRLRENKVGMTHLPESLRALLTHLIDYAGLYPPAALALPVVVENYRRYLASPENWILNRLVLPVSKLIEVELTHDLRFTLLAETDPG